MLNRNDLIARYTVNGETNWTEYRNAVHTYRAAIDTLEQITSAHIADRKTPAETVSEWVSAVGYDVATVALSSWINSVGDWDARVSLSNRTWAVRVTESFDGSSAIDLCIYSDRIHRAHLDQLADAFRAYVPEAPKPTEPETVEPEAPQESQEAPQSDEATEAETSAQDWTPAPGDVVCVSGGYHANSNGLFFIASESGRGWWLEPLTKAGKIKKTGAQGWPLVSYCSDRQKNREADRHNATHAKMEPAPEVPTCYVAEYFRTKAAELDERYASIGEQSAYFVEQSRPYGALSAIVY